MEATSMTTALASLTSVVNSVITMITGNEVLMVFFVSGVLMVGIKAVKKLTKVR